jgi:Na+/H+-dicarboxylate symporter
MKNFMMKYWLLVTLLVLITFVFTVGDQLPLSVKNVFYSISTVIRQMLLVLLPFLVFPYITSSLSKLKGKGALLILSILLGAAFFLFLAILYSYGVSALCFPWFDFASNLQLSETNDVCSLIDLSFEPAFSIEIALISGLVCGLFLSYKPTPSLLKFVDKYCTASTFFFEKVFTPLLPFYIFGLLLKLHHDNDCGNLFSVFKNVILLVIIAQALYIIFLFVIGSGGHIKKAFQSLKNALPAGLTGFSSISSVIALPVTLKAAEENVEDPNIAKLTIPTTVNCNALGDAVSMPLFALLLYYIAFQELPSLTAYLPFALTLTLAQFGAVSVAGGSVIIIIPVLISKLQFTHEMVGLLTAIAIFADPWGTGCNVMGNSGYVTFVDRYFNRKHR